MAPPAGGVNSYTVQRVAPQHGLPGVNAFRRRPGHAEEVYVEVPPGGNAVRSYVDLEAPDEAPLADLLEFVEAVAAGPNVPSLPITVADKGVTLTFGCDFALAPAWREELRDLSRYLERPRPLSSRAVNHRPKLIEVALPLDAISDASAKEKAIRSGHPSSLHLWWARRPLAACRAVLFGQLVDDPSGWPEEFPTEAAQDQERERLFQIIRELVIWENSNDPEILYKSRLAIARTFARRDRYAAMEQGLHSDSTIETVERPPSEVVNEYLLARVPPVHDPFAGGGSIPLEAQRLGLRAIASDLNPVPVLINRALIEIPSRFAGMAPVNPASNRRVLKWRGAAGLAADIDYFGRRVLDSARKSLSRAYPPLTITPAIAERRPDLKALVGESLTVIAWIWARTVPSPNPALRGAPVPLVSTYWLSKKSGKEVWLDPTVTQAGWGFSVRLGVPPADGLVDQGTKTGKGNFNCILSGQPISSDYIREQGRAGNLGSRMIAVVAEGKRGRVYLEPTPEHVAAAGLAIAVDPPDTDLPVAALGFRVQNYGLRKHRDLFTQRQLAAMTTFSDAIIAVIEEVVTAAAAANVPPAIRRPYAEAVATYLTFALDKLADLNNSLCRWEAIAQCPRQLFGRQAMPMIWDFAEANVLSESSGSWQVILDGIVRSAEAHLSTAGGGSAVKVFAADAASDATYESGEVFSTDPPYYDNVPYADLSDFFYVWMRRTLRSVDPALFATVLVPKASELIAEPWRFEGSKDRAARFFEDGMKGVFRAMAKAQSAEAPMAVYYAFKQAESDEDDDEEVATSSTGWETMLHAMMEAGLVITGTWPIRTENASRLRGQSSNALATSVVLLCRRRDVGAAVTTRAEFRRLLRAELPASLRHLQHGNIAPVDVAQAAIGPGMAIFSRHAKILEANGKAMAVRTALQLINEVLDEFLSETEGDLDADTRFAVTWYESHSYDAGLFGEAETLAKARNVSVAGVAEAGILTAAAGKVRLHRRAEMPAEWNPATDKHLTVWEATQHLIRRLEERGEGPASDLLRQLGPVADQARALAYRLYSACERRKWADEARAYNGLVVAWPELERLAAQSAGAAPAKPKTAQESLF